MFEFEKFGMKKTGYLVEIDIYPFENFKPVCDAYERLIIHSSDISDFVHKFDFSKHLISIHPLDVWTFGRDYD